MAKLPPCGLHPLPSYAGVVPKREQECDYRSAKVLPPIITATGVDVSAGLS
jgi:hypothetical protein